MNDKANSIDMQGLVEAYSSLRPVYELLGDMLTAILKGATRELGVSALVGARVKGLPNFAGKIVRKAGKYHSPLQQMTDLCGVRVITECTGDIPAVNSYIREQFLIDEANSEDTLDRLNESEFSYRSVHFIVSLRPGTLAGVVADVIEKRCLGNPVLRNELQQHADRLFEQRTVEESRRLNLPPGPVFKAEVQVRSLLQHAWASISHDRLYKTKIKLPWEMQREIHRVAAVLEEADATFAQVIRRISTFESYFGAYLDSAELQREIEMEKSVLGFEPDNLRQVARVGRLLATAERWGEVREFLAPWVAKWEQSPEGGQIVLAHAQDDPGCGIDLAALASGKPPLAPASALNVSVLVDCGLSLIALGDRDQGRRHLYHALLLDPFRVETALFLGDSFEGQQDPVAFSYYRAAFHQDPSDPWVLCRYLGKLIVSPAAAPTQTCPQALIDQAIRRCEEQMRVRINLPHAWFNWAFLHLLAGQPTTALQVYARAALACDPPVTDDGQLGANSGCPEPSQYQRSLAKAIDFLFRLQRGLQIEKRELPGLGAAIRLLTLVRVVRFSKPENWAEELRTLRLPDFPLATVPAGTPVVWLAGTTAVEATADADLPPLCRDMLLEAFRPFAGLLLGGGTTSGISGFGGDVVFERPGQVRRLACLPASLRGSLTVHPAYAIARTRGNDFSPFEAIQLWIELVARGIPPASVHVLGVGGGAISEVEYRLGVLLGAKVGLLRGSGRSADLLLKDPDWASRPNLIGLPYDRETLKCFVVPPRQTTLIDETSRDRLAQHLHDQYRPKTLKDALKEKREQWEWPHLDEVFKNSNRACIDHIETKLKAVGLSIVPRKADEPLNFQFTREQIETLAEMEHGRFVAERLLDGWKLADIRDNEKKLRPNLVAWADLPDFEKDKDRVNVSQIPILLHQAGYKIARNPATPSP